jgi:enamine deaminase RidA (YjgF/YER057c/UK114 family)
MTGATQAEFKRERINPAGFFKHPAYDRAVTVSGASKLVFVAGLTAADENYKCIAPGDYRAQYIEIIRQLDIVLKNSGASWDDVVFRRIFAVDVEQFQQKVLMDRSIIVPWGADYAPPSTLIGVTRLSFPDFVLEIDLLAATQA